MSREQLKQNKPESTSLYRHDPLSLKIAEQEVDNELETLQENEESDFLNQNKSAENRLERQRRLARERKKRWRLRQDQEQLRLFSKLVQRKRREQETPDEAKARRLADRLSKRRRLEQETPQQTRERRKGNLNIEVSNRSKMETSMELDESFYEVVHVLETTFICQGCGATSTSTSIPIDQTVELTCISCHRKSKTKLPDIPPHPLANAEKKFNCMNESMAMEVETNDPLKFAKKVRTPKVSSNKQLFKVFGDKLCDFCGNKFTTKSSIVNHMKMHQTKEPARERVKIF